MLQANYATLQGKMNEIKAHSFETSHNVMQYEVLMSEYSTYYSALHVLHHSES